MSSSAFAVAQPKLSPVSSAKLALKRAADFFYGDKTRTNRTLAFGYLCVSLYTFAMLYQGVHGAACGH